MTYDQETNRSMSGQQITPDAEVYDVNGDKAGTVSHQGQQGRYLVVERCTCTKTSSKSSRA